MRKRRTAVWAAAVAASGILSGVGVVGADVASARPAVSFDRDCPAGGVVVTISNPRPAAREFLVEILFSTAYQADKVSVGGGGTAAVLVLVPPGEQPTIRVSQDAVVLAEKVVRKDCV